MKELNVGELRDAIRRLDVLVAAAGELIVSRRGKAIARVLPVSPPRGRPDHADLRARTPRLATASAVSVRAERDRPATCNGRDPRADTVANDPSRRSEMTVQVTIDLPEDVLPILRTNPTAFVAEMRIAAAVKWYEQGRVSQGKGAELADLSRQRFIDALTRYGVSPIQVTPEQLEHEFLSDA